MPDIERTAMRIVHWYVDGVGSLTIFIYKTRIVHVTKRIGGLTYDHDPQSAH